MKKTIAILLILVIGMVGVFAATDTAAVDITTEITPYSKIGVTSVSIVGAFELDEEGDDTTTPISITSSADFQSFLDSRKITAPVSVTATTDAAKETIGYLTYYTNKPTGLTATFAATPLADNASSNAVTTLIKYTVTVGAVSKESGSTKNTNGSSSESISLVAANQSTVVTGSKAIEVYLNSTDYQAAAVATGDYVATITFTYTTD